MMWEGVKSARDFGRLHDIGSVLVRYGFGDLVQRLGLAPVLERAGRVLHLHVGENHSTLTPPQRFAQALVELGPCYIKLGQVLATRVDLLTAEWIAELEKLQDRAPPLPFAMLRPQVEADVGAPLESVFANVETQPLATASIAQVHRATLPDGTAVVLKIRRPDIEHQIAADMHLLKRAADIAHARLPDVRRYRVPDVVRQLQLSLRRELDLSAEARNAERVAEAFRDDPNIVIPRIYWQWTTPRLNVQQYIDGIPGRDISSIDAAGLDRQLLARRGAEAVLRMILVDGFFHADPHLGNFLCLPENHLALLDFGMVGRLSDTRREQVVTLLHAIVSKESAGVVEILLDWAGDVAAKEDALASEVDEFIDHYHGLALKRINFAAFINDLVALLRDHELALPPDLALLFKAFITLDGVGRRLDPDFDAIACARPFLERVAAERYLPTTIVTRGWRQLRAITDLLNALPNDVRQLLRAARRGAIQVNIDMPRLDHFGRQLDRAASRLTIGVVTAAMIVGSAIVMTVSQGPEVLGFPLLGVVGFVAACLGGMWLLFSIWRSGKN